MLQELAYAFCFLTLLPINPNSKYQEKTFSRSIKFFTLTGIVFGLINVFCLYLHHFHDSKLLTALLIVSLNLFFSGALHLEGLADCFDAIAASKKTREETLQVLTDSRVGAFGAIAVSLMIVSKIIIISEINFENDWIFYSLIFFIVPFLSRFMMVIVLLFQVDFKACQKDSKSLAVIKKYQKPTLDFFVNLFSLKIPALVFLICFPITFSKLIRIDYFVVPWMILAWFVYTWLKFKLKGHNGDSMGAGLEINEAILFLFFIFI